MAQEFAEFTERDMPNCILIGAPIDEGQRRAGCVPSLICALKFGACPVRPIFAGE